ncbi:LytR/AlgR family response regulator transcription factor [Lutispora sp.]|uniref:LytR/AlgR family response regulator transcription factor n=1 Tax=Lutispora sp. TaxID=2828727 RepID=UPI000ED4B195|nr:LytTR family DNA-binding domain-containing protein [Lutispora sp.]MEA4963712.1 LytTR family DNA-binding domain-containing protein [Lutispora sp.]HCJ56246.1 DNA-binding response regulator [Clostridiaceae bacterium]
MQINTIVIDDEYPSREELKFLISKMPFIKIVGEANSGLDGLELVKKLRPDLVLTDIRMPDITGIQLINEINNLGIKCKVIFTTAYDQYAIKAFEVNAVDYILKPYDEERVAKAVIRIKNILENKSSEAANNPGNTVSLNKLPLWKGDKLILVDIDSIIYAYTEGRDIFIKADKETYLSSHSLHELEEKLKGKGFFRTHRSYLVNMNKINEISPWFNGAYAAKIGEANDEIIISKKQVKKFKEILGI